MKIHKLNQLFGSFNLWIFGSLLGIFANLALFLFGSLNLGILGYFKVPSVFAQSTPRNTISVTPQLTQLDLSTDQPETLLYYKNSSPYSMELSLSVEDVKELEDRNPVGILDPKEALNYKYSLSSWVTLERQTLLLNPGEQRSLKVSIAKEKLSPGGHYGTILAEISQNTEKGKVKIKGILSSLLFVRASTGNEIESAKASFANTNKAHISFPTEFDFRFQNIGNVEVVPYGILEVKNQREKLIARGIVNEESSITLPEAIRTYTVKTKPNKNIILPGKYTATLSLHYGKSNKKIVIKQNFSTLGDTNALKFGTGLLVVLLAILIILRFVKSKIKHRKPHPTSIQ